MYKHRLIYTRLTQRTNQLTDTSRKSAETVNTDTVKDDKGLEAKFENCFHFAF